MYKALETARFVEHQRGKDKLDFSILDGMYQELGKLKLVRYGDGMIVTKGEEKVVDLREQ